MAAKEKKGPKVLDAILNGIGLENGEEDDEYVDEPYEDEDDFEEEPPKEKAPKKSKPKFTPEKKSRRGERGDEMYNIHRMHARTIEDGKQITELLKNKTTVIINLEGVDLAVAQRIIDYTSGSCFALDAKLESISSYIFMASPNTANVTADISGENTSSIDVPGSDFTDLL